MTSAHHSPIAASRFVAVSACILVLVCAPPVLAGGICGQVTDASTGAPVAGAGVIARLADGTPAGAHDVTDMDGHYCILNLAAGTYTLEVRVDDYLVAWVNGVEVVDDLSSVPISVLPAPFVLDPPWPNPMSAGLRLRLQIREPMALDLRIYDARGRLVRAWTAPDIGEGPSTYQWNGLDRAGRPVPTGLYFVRVKGTDHTATRRIIVIR